MEQSRERSSALGVVAIEKGSLLVTLDYGRQLYLFIYICCICFFSFSFFFILFWQKFFCIDHLSIRCISKKFYTFKHHCQCESHDSFSKKNADWMVIWSFFVYIFFLFSSYFIKTSIIVRATLFAPSSSPDDSLLKPKCFNTDFPLW